MSSYRTNGAWELPSRGKMLLRERKIQSRGEEQGSQLTLHFDSYIYVCIYTIIYTYISYIYIYMLNEW